MGWQDHRLTDRRTSDRNPTTAELACPDRVAVIGDVGGHLEALRLELVRLGADPRTGRLPARLTVVQVGDLVHRGPDSAGVVALVDRYLNEQPGQWIQLVGNHESLYLRQPSFRWPARVDDSTAATLQGWWATGAMTVAAAVSTDRGEYLVTHAGLTAGFWRTVLGMPTSARDAALALNRLRAAGHSSIFRTGAMLGRRPTSCAGPLWAETATELIPSWFQTQVPFNQIHGHCAVSNWSTGQMRGSPAVIDSTSADPLARHEIATLRGGQLIGVDPGHGTEPAATWSAWTANLVGPVTT